MVISSQSDGRASQQETAHDSLKPLLPTERLCSQTQIQERPQYGKTFNIKGDTAKFIPHFQQETLSAAAKTTMAMQVITRSRTMCFGPRQQN